MQINKHVRYKLCRLSSFLHHACKEFEHAANEIKDKKIRMSIRSVAMRTRQYLNELNSQLQMLRVSCVYLMPEEKYKKHTHITARSVSDKIIVQKCCNTEAYFDKAYRSILNEFFPFKPLRDMLRYQITGISNAFRQLKLLNAVMPSPAGIYA
jgi:hypothetical protein